MKGVDTFPDYRTGYVNVGQVLLVTTHNVKECVRKVQNHRLNETGISYSTPTPTPL